MRQTVPLSLLIFGRIIQPEKRPKVKHNIKNPSVSVLLKHTDKLSDILGNGHWTSCGTGTRDTDRGLFVSGLFCNFAVTWMFSFIWVLEFWRPDFVKLLKPLSCLHFVEYNEAALRSPFDLTSPRVSDHHPLLAGQYLRVSSKSVESMEPCRFSDFKTAALHHMGNPMGGGPITYCDVRIQSQGSKHIRIFLPAEKPECICTSVNSPFCWISLPVLYLLFCIFASKQLFWE